SRQGLDLAPGSGFEHCGMTAPSAADLPECGSQRHDDERKGVRARPPGDPTRDSQAPGMPPGPDPARKRLEGGSMTAGSSELGISAAGLRKSFGDKVVLDGVDLDVQKGTIFALLGPNGAGKTTTVNILSTLIGADAGEAAVAGHDLAREPDSVRAAIGVTGQFSAVDKLLTGEENLLLMA